ncbi:MAG: DUF3788 domain-containing protein [Bacteroidales bacterium]|jgi:hypothetical protein|nr:DUF3788 domain-containing protein [Bacteroidales bacterium]
MITTATVIETPLLRAKEIYPKDTVLERVLGEKSYALYDQMVKMSSNEYGLTQNWYYYRDQKTWLCKVLFKKKNIYWISVWDKYFKITFYFTDRYAKEFLETEGICQEYKDLLAATAPVGKLIPLVITIENEQQIENLKDIIEFKKNIK